ALQMMFTLLPAVTMDWRTGRLTTIIVKDFKSLIMGDPSSATRTVKTFVPMAASVGVQLKSPLVGLTEAPVGAPASRLNVSTLTGMSGSAAIAVKVTGLPAYTVRSAIGDSTGGLFTSRTITVKICVALRPG